MRTQDYLDLGASENRDTFQSRLVRFAEGMDFFRVTVAVIVEKPGSAPAVYSAGNIPDDFVSASRSVADAARDPVLKRLKGSTRPFVYDQGLYVAEGASDLWEQQAAYGYKTGVSLSLHAPGGKHFLLGVDRDQPMPKDDGSLTRVMADLQLLGAYAQETAIRVLVPHDDSNLPVRRLSPREREILGWTREGKTGWAIGQILGISERTVDFHVRNASAKLNAPNKHVAVLRAQALGLI